jgi:hypothetical protein
MREDFEKWAKSGSFNLKPSIAPGKYADICTQFAWAGWQAATALQAEEIERLSQCLAKANGHDDHVMDAFKYGTGFMQGGKRVDPKDVYLQDPQAERVRELEECLGHVMGAWEYDGISDEHGAIAMKADELISATAREVGE